MHTSHLVTEQGSQLFFINGQRANTLGFGSSPRVLLSILGDQLTKAFCCI